MRIHGLKLTKEQQATQEMLERAVPRPMPKLPEPPPIKLTGGIRREHCRKCGGSIVTTGHGILRQVCADCGRTYEPMRIGG